MWDVVPSKAVRSPYTGFIEFSVSHYHWVPPETRDKFMRTHPGLVEKLMDMSGWKYRYEYDVGPEGLELTKALARAAGAEWDDVRKRDVCWDNAARKGQTVSDRGKQ